MLAMHCVVRRQYCHAHFNVQERPCGIMHGRATIGGELDFVYGRGKDGIAYWAETEDSGLVSDKWYWDRPTEELLDTGFDVKLADQLLHGQGKFECDSVKCSAFSELDRSAPNWGYQLCCLIAVVKQPDLDSLRTVREMTVEAAAADRNWLCIDSIGIGGIDRGALTIDAHRVYAAFADAIGHDRSCEGMHACYALMHVHSFTSTLPGGCRSNLKPLCKEGQCTTPSCEDALPHCQKASEAGKLARMYCPETCGCNDAFSSLILTAPNLGCPHSCLAKHAEQIAVRPCVDAESRSAEVTEYANALLEHGIASGNKVYNWFGTVIQKDACRIYDVLYQGTMSAEAKMHETCRPSNGNKGLQPFCPVACGCQGGQLGCPKSCPATYSANNAVNRSS